MAKKCIKTILWLTLIEQLMDMESCQIPSSNLGCRDEGDPIKLISAEKSLHYLHVGLSRRHTTTYMMPVFSSFSITLMFSLVNLYSYYCSWAFMVCMGPLSMDSTAWSTRPGVLAVLAETRTTYHSTWSTDLCILLLISDDFGAPWALWYGHLATVETKRVHVSLNNPCKLNMA